MENSKAALKVTNWQQQYEQQAYELLQAYAESSMFLLNNLKVCGPVISAQLYSGNFKCLLKNDKVVAVFCLCKSGNVLCQTDRKEDYSQAILAACLTEHIEIRGCIAEWSLASSFWHQLTSKFPELTTTNCSKEKLYSLALVDVTQQDEPNIRFLHEDDFDQWELLDIACYTELNFPLQGSRDKRFAEFREDTAKKLYWGLFIKDRLIATVAYNAHVADMAQIGGVYTLPEYRHKGYAKKLLTQMLSDSRHKHGITKLILFTGEKNIAARRLYESLGFKQIGSFGLIFGE